MRRRIWIVAALLNSIAGSLTAHEFTEEKISFSCDVAEIGGTLTIPEHEEDGKGACVVIVGGTLSNTRDGTMVREGVPNRDALRRLAQALAVKGFASLRYDKVGYGYSKSKPGWSGSYRDEAQLAAAAIRLVRDDKRFARVAVAAESAGAYLACLAAKDGVAADAYVFLGGHCDSGAAIYEYNFARLVRLADGDPKWRELAETQLRFELALGRCYPAMFDAAAKGASDFEIIDGSFKRKIGVTRRKEEWDFPPDEMFRFIKVPAIAFSGQYDLNVPPDHAARIFATLRGSGNHSCTCVMIPRADHNFQIGPDDEATRLRERYTFASFEREYSPNLYTEIVAWLDDTLLSPTSKLPKTVQAAKLPVRAVEHMERDAKTDSTPVRIQLAPGIQIVEDIADKQQTTGGQTLEGGDWPLALG